MIRKIGLCVVLGAFFLPALVAAETGEQVLREWHFNQPGNLEGWSPGGHVRDTRVADGVLRTTVIDWDPILIHEVFPEPLPATATQVIEIRMFAPRAGNAEFFWTNTTQTQYGGFSPGKQTAFSVRPGWQTYRVRPFWQAEGRIIRLRLDLPPLEAGEVSAEYQIDFIRILELGSGGPPAQPNWVFAQDTRGWQLEGEGKLWWENGALCAQLVPGSRLVAPPIAADADLLGFLCLEMQVDRPGSARVYWASGKANGLQSSDFPLVSGDQFRVYNVPLGGLGGWQTPIVYLAVEPNTSHPARVRLKSVKLTEEPAGPVDLQVKRLFVKSAIPRVNRELEVVAHLINRGGQPADRIQAELMLPEGWEFAGGPSGLREIGPLEFGETQTLAWKVIGRRVGPAKLRLRVSGRSELVVESQDEILPALDLPKEDYVPEPQPVRGPYEVGVYYFPGWGQPSSWVPIEAFPERRPVLGFYREGLPEIADWHIKWAVEHGITFFCYDWYWTRGERRLEHALHDGFFRARYRHLMKFCLLWANHFGPGEHNAEDNERVCRYWIENYFRRPEYFKIDGRPLLVIFSVHSLQRDFGIEGTRKAIELWHRMTEEAGVGRILVAGCGNPTNIKQMKEMGFDAVTGYNWPRCGIGERNWVPFSEVAANYETHWWRPLAQAGLMPVITPVSAGWDSRPWHGDRALVLTDCTPEAFQKHLESAKRFIDETGQPRVVLIEAWNEFGEGSFCEPHKQYGFGHLEAIRRVFAPESRKPPEFGPEDVGLPLLEFETLEKPQPRTRWEFETPGDPEGWAPMMGLGDVAVESGKLVARTTSSDPAFACATKIKAKDFTGLEIAVAVTSPKPREMLELFWSTLSAPYRQQASVKAEVTADGKPRVYRLSLQGHPFWRGVITGLRLDPCTSAGAKVEIDFLRFVSAEEPPNASDNQKSP